MFRDDLLDPREMPTSVSLGAFRSSGSEVEHRRPVGELHVDVRRVMLLGVEEEPVRTGPEQGGHADLADGSAGSHHARMRFTAAYLRNPAVSDG